MASNSSSANGNAATVAAQSYDGSPCFVRPSFPVSGFRETWVGISASPARIVSANAAASQMPPRFLVAPIVPAHIRQRQSAPSAFKCAAACSAGADGIAVGDMARRLFDVAPRPSTTSRATVPRTSSGRAFRAASRFSAAVGSFGAFQIRSYAAVCAVRFFSAQSFTPPNSTVRAACSMARRTADGFGRVAPGAFSIMSS